MGRITPEQCNDDKCPALADDGPGVWVNGSITRDVPASVQARVESGTETPVWIERSRLLELIEEHFTPEELFGMASRRTIAAATEAGIPLG